ncbi:hypothetical protein [Streptomyces sp. T028]|uniref:hypothetical protein n=1 Tax=Streptomyces sp. T028 TaxID=3394379 RepID=UPI003A87E765
MDRTPAGEEPEIPETYVRHGLVGALRAVDSMSRARAACSMVITPDDRTTAAEAHAEQPLPGYTRWVLSVRPDCPAVRDLEVLAMGHPMFPARAPDAEDALCPLVRDHLGDRAEAWAVPAQIAETFHGTAPELLMTAGAIA